MQSLHLYLCFLLILPFLTIFSPLQNLHLLIFLHIIKSISYHNHSLFKHSHIFTVISDDNLLEKDAKLICVFVINPVLLGMLKTLNYSFYYVKSKICKAIFKDIKQEKMFDENSNLYNLLVNEFGLKNLKFN